MQLYTWQKECLEAWQKNDFHGIVNVVTGAGKTVLALAAIMQLEHRYGDLLRIRIVVPKLPLINQWASAIKKFIPASCHSEWHIGYYSGERKDNPDRKCMIYVINSARYSLARHILADMKEGYHVLLIADECHHYASPENRKIFDFLPADTCQQELYHSIGLSATPQVRGYDSVLVPALGREIYWYGFTDAVREKNVCDFAVYQIAVSFSHEEMEKYQELTDRLSILHRRLLKSFPFLQNKSRAEFFQAVRLLADGEDEAASPAKTFLHLSYQRQALNCMAVSRISCTCGLIGQLDQSSRIIIFGERIRQAEQVYQKLSRRFPNQVGCYHSGMTPDAKKRMLSGFRDGSIRILVSCRALDEGVDVPDATVGIILSGTSVNRQRIQRLGRILRHQPGKRLACLYYLYIRESAEDSAFLSDLEKSPAICNLSYSAVENTFCHPAYEATAVQILSEAAGKGVSGELLKEMRTCLLSGLVRPDWLHSPEAYAELIRRAEGRREKNYWLCMKWMHSLSTSPSSNDPEAEETAQQNVTIQSHADL